MLLPFSQSEMGSQSEMREKLSTGLHHKGQISEKRPVIKKTTNMFRPLSLHQGSKQQTT